MNEFETAVVKEPSVYEPLFKFYRSRVACPDCELICLKKSIFVLTNDRQRGKD